MFFRAQVRRALQRVPGKQRFGIYRFLPFFFVLGGAMEWIMIKVRVGQETFCTFTGLGPPLEAAVPRNLSLALLVVTLTLRNRIAHVRKRDQS